MTYADEIRRQAEAASRDALPAITAALWRAYGDGKVTEAEAEALSGLIEARRLVVGKAHIHNLSGTQVLRSPNPGTSTNADRSGIAMDRQSSPRRAVGSRPRTDASMERRRRWAASGRLPPGIAARFTLAEQAVLALVAAETARRKDCRLAIDNLAAVTGVSRTTVKNAIREAARLGLLTIEERQVTGWRNDTNVIRIVGREWLAWLRLARTRDPLSKLGSSAPAASAQGGGVKSATTTHTQISDQRESRPAAPSRRRSADTEPPSRHASRTAGA